MPTILQRLNALHDFMVNVFWKSTIWLQCECGSHWGAHHSPMPDWIACYVRTPFGIYPRFKLMFRESVGHRTRVDLAE